MPVLSIKQILEGPKISNWQGSEKTRDMVAEQIKKIWGESEVKNYNADKNALPFTSWLKLGYKPKRGSKALKSVTYVEKKEADGSITKFPRTVNLFYYRSVEPIKNND